jgi:hypothetical protein
LYHIVFYTGTIATSFSAAFVTPNVPNQIMGNRASSPTHTRARRQMAAVGDSTITGVLAREILDSRGNPTVEVRRKNRPFLLRYQE